MEIKMMKRKEDKDKKREKQREEQDKNIKQAQTIDAKRIEKRFGSVQSMK